jgi:predicted O-methyltransferase YrrM
VRIDSPRQKPTQAGMSRRISVGLLMQPAPEVVNYKGAAAEHLFDKPSKGIGMAIRSKIAALARISMKDPREALQRIRSFTVFYLHKSSSKEAPFPYEESEFSDCCEIFYRTFSIKVADVLVEPELFLVRENVRRRLAAARRESPIALTQNGGDDLCNICYLACRALRPAAVVETGVAHGITSAYILAALQKNGRGRLYSIDRPPLAMGSDDYVGICIPDALKANHTLIRGDARSKLPALLASLGKIDMFIHDSDHSYNHMRFELGLAFRHLRTPGVIISDDVNRNAAFHEFIGSTKPSAASVIGRGDAEGGCAGASVFA